MGTARTTTSRTARVAALIVTVGVLAAACSSGEPEREEGTPGVTKAGDLSVFDLQPGDCLGDLEELTDQLTELPVVPCTDVHRIEVYHLIDHEADTYPGEAELGTFADGACLAEFGAYTGVDYFSVGTSLYFSYLYPTFDSWNDSDDHGIVCVVGSSADLVDSVAGRGLDLPLAPDQ